MNWYIYKLTCIANGKGYVGLTKRPTRRKWDHLRSGSRKCPLLSRAVRKHGSASFNFEILAECATAADACEAERKLIVSMNTKKPHGYNISDGGEGATGVSPTPETRAKLSAALTGRETPWLTGQKKSVSWNEKRLAWMKDPARLAEMKEKCRLVALKRWERDKDKKLEFGRALNAAFVKSRMEAR